MKSDKLAPIGFYVQVLTYPDGRVRIPQSITRIYPDGKGDVSCAYCDGSLVFHTLLWSCAPRKNFAKPKNHGSFVETWEWYEGLDEAAHRAGIPDDRVGILD